MIVSPCRVAAAVVADFLFVGVDDVFHQEVSLKAVDAVAIQHHFLSAGRTAEAAAIHRHGGPGLEQGGLGRKNKNNNNNNNNIKKEVITIQLKSFVICLLNLKALYPLCCMLIATR